MSTGYGWEGIRQVCPTLLGARNVPERLWAGSVYTRGAITIVHLCLWISLSSSSQWWNGRRHVYEGHSINKSLNDINGINFYSLHTAFLTQWTGVYEISVSMHFDRPTDRPTSCLVLVKGFSGLADRTALFLVGLKSPNTIDYTRKQYVMSN